MNKIFRTLCVLCVTLFALTSCLSDDDNTTTSTYGDVAITQFTLGTLNRYVSSVSSKTGNDTIIKSTLTGTNYPMTIDQLGYQIYNQKALPVGTDIKHVPLSAVSAKNGGLVLIKSMTSDSLKTFSTKDSLDFSQPRTFRVYSTDGQSHRDYTVTLNVSATEGSTFEWTKMSDDIAIENFADKHLVAVGDTVMMVDKGVVVKDGAFFRMNGTTIETSSDLNDWQAVATADLKLLVGAGTAELFALGNDGLLKHSYDNGQSWTDEQLDDDASLLPAENIAVVCCPYAPSDNTDYMLMAGNSQQDETTTTIWRKISQYDPVNESCKWVYMPVDDNNHFVLDRQENLSMAYYEGSVLAVGSMMKLYESRDQGITWYTDSDYALPDNLVGTLLSIATTEDGRLWLITNSGQLWIGTGK